MNIKAADGTYELKVDVSRGIVYEKLLGFIDMQKLHDEYVNKVVPALKGKKWVKCSDMRDYKTTNLGDIGSKHLSFCHENGMERGAVILDSAIVKMQMNRTAKASQTEPMVFDSESAADTWLRQQGH